MLSCNSEKEKKALANSAHPTTKQVWQFQQLCWWLLDAVVLYKISCDSVKDYNMLQADDVEIVIFHLIVGLIKINIRSKTHDLFKQRVH